MYGNDLSLPILVTIHRCSGSVQAFMGYKHTEWVVYLEISGYTLLLTHQSPG
jgi:hypothetical protein